MAAPATPIPTRASRATAARRRSSRATPPSVRRPDGLVRPALQCQPVFRFDQPAGRRPLSLFKFSSLIDRGPHAGALNSFRPGKARNRVVATAAALPCHASTRSVVMAKSYYSTVFDQSADAVWSVIRDFIIIRSRSTARGRAISRTARPATPSAPFATCSTRTCGGGSACWRCPTSSARKPMNSPARRRCRCRISRRPSASRRSSTAAAPSSNGGRRSIASLRRARSASRFSATRLRGG